MLQLNQSVFQKDNGCNVLCQIEMKQSKEREIEKRGSVGGIAMPKKT